MKRKISIIGIVTVMTILIGIFAASNIIGALATTPPAPLQVSAAVESGLDPIANTVSGQQEKVYFVIIADVAGGSGSYNIDVWIRQGSDPLQDLYHSRAGGNLASSSVIPLVWSTLCPTSVSSPQRAVYILINATDVSTGATGQFATTVYIPAGN